MTAYLLVLDDYNNLIGLACYTSFSHIIEDTKNYFNYNDRNKVAKKKKNFKIIIV